MHWDEFCPECDKTDEMTFGKLEYEADGYITRTWECKCGAYGVDRYSLVEREKHHEDNDLKMFQKCSRCGSPTTYMRENEDQPNEGEFCSVCGEWLCKDCVDWGASMKEQGDIVCKTCSIGVDKNDN